MKKKFALIFSLSLVFVLVGCMARVDLMENMSEITKSYFYAENEFISASISVGEREKDYIIDGKSGERTGFSLVTLKFSSSVDEQEIETIIEINGEEQNLILYFNPMSNLYMNDLGYAISDEDKVSITYSGAKLDFEKVKFNVDYQEALKITKKELKKEIKNFVKGGSLDGECYLKILTSQNNVDRFWLFTLVTKADEHINLLINVQSGQILRA